MSDLHSALYIKQQRVGNQLQVQLNPTTEVSNVLLDFSSVARSFPKGASIVLKSGKSHLRLENCDQAWNKPSDRTNTMSLSALVPQRLLSDAPHHHHEPAVLESRKRKRDLIHSRPGLAINNNHGDGTPQSAGSAGTPYRSETSPSRPRQPRQPSPQLLYVVPENESNPPTKKRKTAPVQVASSSRTVDLPSQENNVTSSRSATNYAHNIAYGGAPLVLNRNFAGLAGRPGSDLTGYPVQPTIPSYIPIELQAPVQRGQKRKALESERPAYVPNYPNAAPVTAEAPAPVLETEANPPAKRRKVTPQPASIPSSSTSQQTKPAQELDVAPRSNPLGYPYEPLPAEAFQLADDLSEIPDCLELFGISSLDQETAYDSSFDLFWSNILAMEPQPVPPDTTFASGSSAPSYHQGSLAAGVPLVLPNDGTVTLDLPPELAGNPTLDPINWDLFSDLFRSDIPAIPPLHDQPQLSSTAGYHHDSLQASAPPMLADNRTGILDQPTESAGLPFPDVFMSDFSTIQPPPVQPQSSFSSSAPSYNYDPLPSGELAEPAGSSSSYLLGNADAWLDLFQSTSEITAMQQLPAQPETSSRWKGKGREIELPAASRISHVQPSSLVSPYVPNYAPTTYSTPVVGETPAEDVQAYHSGRPDRLNAEGTQTIDTQVASGRKRKREGEMGGASVSSEMEQLEGSLDRNQSKKRRTDASKTKSGGGRLHPHEHIMSFTE